MVRRCLEDVTDRPCGKVDTVEDRRELPLQEYTHWGRSNY